MKSKYKLGEKVMITKSELYPNSSYLMGTVSNISSIDTDTFAYDIHFGITGVKDERNVLEEDLKLYE